MNQHSLNPLPRASEVFVPSNVDVCDIVYDRGYFCVVVLKGGGE